MGESLPVVAAGSRIVAWFSCGAASAVATKLTLSQYAATCEVRVARCIVEEEHEDNERFAADCEKWFGVPVLTLRSSEYRSAEEVWKKRSYMSGKDGAPCTMEMKKAVRWEFEKAEHPDYQVFGYTAEEKRRVSLFAKNNPDVRMLTPLIEHHLGKADCYALIARAGIVLPAMYRLGFNNNNCIGCVKASSPTYWNRVRRHFPDVFEKRAKLSREIGCRLVKGTSGKRARFFLDELNPQEGLNDSEPELDCSPLCYLADLEME